jgi:uncharacterized protein YceK
MVAFTALCLGGCGTILNFESGRPEPYMGVKRDLWLADQAWSENKDAVITWFIDLCLSGVGDTLTLPFVWWQQRATTLSRLPQVEANSSADGKR